MEAYTLSWCERLTPVHTCERDTVPFFLRRSKPQILKLIRPTERLFKIAISCAHKIWSEVLGRVAGGGIVVAVGEYEVGNATYFITRSAFLSRPLERAGPLVTCV